MPATIPIKYVSNKKKNSVLIKWKMKDHWCDKEQNLSEEAFTQKMVPWKRVNVLKFSSAENGMILRSARCG